MRHFFGELKVPSFFVGLFHGELAQDLHRTQQMLDFSGNFNRFFSVRGDEFDDPLLLGFGKKAVDIFFCPEDEIFFNVDDHLSPASSSHEDFFLRNLGLRDGCELLVAKENFYLLDVFLSARNQDFFKEVDADGDLA